MSVWYTLVISSCARHDLLRETLDSLVRTNCGGQKPRETFILEDSDVPMPEWLKENIHFYSANLGKINWLGSEGRRGQLYSLDTLYSKVTTDYVLHFEDDWTVERGNWLQPSADILIKYPKISTVSLRGDHCNGHPNIDQPPFEGFKIQSPYWRGFGGINFNPGLRRMADYRKHGSYGALTNYGVHGIKPEQEISKHYLDAGYRVAVLPSEGNKGFITHTGGARSRAIEPVPVPKILIAVLACHKYSYGKWESSDSPAFNKANAYNGEAYGTDIHISGTNDRIQAVRDTWLKDCEDFAPYVDVRFFYGGPAPDGWKQKDDEVLLDCPDDYEHLPEKTIAICNWAVQNDYILMAKMDDDTAIYADRFVREGIGLQADYAGYANGKVMTGGTGYWLSKKAMQIVAGGTRQSWAEDVTTSQLLFRQNIQGVHLDGHRTGRGHHWFYEDKFDPTVDMTGITAFHAVQPDVMRDWWNHKEKMKNG